MLLVIFLSSSSSFLLLSDPFNENIVISFIPHALMLLHLSCTACGGGHPITYLTLPSWSLIRPTYFSVATHIFTASSTALDRSPFFPPNISRALSLSFLSSSSGSTALILPTSITNNIFARHALHVFPVSKVSYAFAGFFHCSCHHLCFTLLIRIIYYVRIRL